MSHLRFVVPEDEFARAFFQMPLDIATAAAALRERGHTVSLWDRRVEVAPPDGPPVDGLILVTAIADRAQCYPLDIGPIKEAARRARELHPGSWIVACGPHATQLPEATLHELAVDHVSLGEVDAAAVYAADVLLHRGDDPVPAILNSPAASLDELPVPAFDLLPLQHYKAEVFDGGQLYQGPSGMIFAARGCTYGCTFCHLPFGTRMRTRPVDRVLAEVDALTELGIKSAFFLDYVFGINPRFYGELCEGLRTRDLSWTGQTRTEIVLKSDVQKWADAGCRGMWLGAESPAVAMTGVNKRVAEGDVHAAVAKLEAAGIQPFAFIIIGLPGDPACLTGSIVDWVASLPAKFGINQLFLRPGTTLYEELAPRYLQGRMPSTWDEVKQVTDAYRQEYPVDLNALEMELLALPNNLGNGWTVHE